MNSCMRRYNANVLLDLVDICSSSDTTSALMAAINVQFLFASIFEYNRITIRVGR